MRYSRVPGVKMNTYRETSIKTVMRPEVGAFTPYKRAEPNGKTDFLFSPGKSSVNEKPIYFKLFIPLMDSVYYSPANFLFYISPLFLIVQQLIFFLQVNILCLSSN